MWQHIVFVLKFALLVYIYNKWQLENRKSILINYETRYICRYTGCTYYAALLIEAIGTDPQHPYHHHVSKWVITFRQQGSYKPCNHNLHIGMIVYPHIGNTQATGHKQIQERGRKKKHKQREHPWSWLPIVDGNSKSFCKILQPSRGIFW